MVHFVGLFEPIDGSFVVADVEILRRDVERVEVQGEPGFLNPAGLPVPCRQDVVVNRQGEVHWIDFGKPIDSEPTRRRPCLILQNDAFNASAISTVVVVMITSNLRLGQAFGNVTLRKGEAGLRRKSVVNVSQIATVDRSVLNGRIGTLSRRRLDQVLGGVYSLLNPVAL